MIISLVNQKGGVGKTTAAINLAASMVRKNVQLLFIDADPQGSAAQWHSIENNEAFAFRSMDDPDTLMQKHPQFESGYDFVIIDSPPAIGAIARAILAVSDLVIVPLSPSPLDIWSCWGTLDLIGMARKSNPRLQAQMLINRKVTGTRVGRDAREALEAFKVSIFKTEMHQRIAYVESMIAGVSVLQFAPGGKAANEIETLCEELLSKVRLAGKPAADRLSVEYA